MATAPRFPFKLCGVNFYVSPCFCIFYVYSKIVLSISTRRRFKSIVFPYQQKIKNAFLKVSWGEFPFIHFQVSLRLVMKLINDYGSGLFSVFAVFVEHSPSGFGWNISTLLCLEYLGRFWGILTRTRGVVTPCKI